MRVRVGNRKIELHPSRRIGEGGEAEVYDLGAGLAAKIFKPAKHADYAADPEQRRAVELRLREHQQKLPAFPQNVPARLVAPQTMILPLTGSRIIGYAMPLISGAEVLLRYGERSFRDGRIGQQTVTDVLRDLHALLEQTHAAGIVIGDFNDLNVLVRGTETYLIDADSYQFDVFPCRGYTERFLDPLLAESGASRPELARPYRAEADWYAFAIMLMQSLLYVGPYGGVYRPADRCRWVPSAARPLHRITVFDEDVRYPKPALRFDILPDDLLQYLHRAFKCDVREVFPRRLLDNIRWTWCSACGAEHARAVCPSCHATHAALVRQVTRVRGTVTATRVAHTDGELLHVAFTDGRLAWVAHEKRRLVRENGTSIAALATRPRDLNIRFGERTTYIGSGREVASVIAGREPERIAVDRAAGAPSFDVGERHLYWTAGGALWRSDICGPERVAEVLADQTLFWVGPRFGFGFYRAHELVIAFVFDAEARGVNDGVRVHRFPGQLIDAHAVFSSELCWFFTLSAEAGRTVHQASVIRADGAIVATARSDNGEAEWWAGYRGACASGTALFVPTDQGIVRIGAAAGVVRLDREFPDTEPFVSREDRLLAGTDGLYVVGRRDVTRLEIR